MKNKIKFLNVTLLLLIFTCINFNVYGKNISRKIGKELVCLYNMTLTDSLIPSSGCTKTVKFKISGFMGGKFVFNYGDSSPNDTYVSGGIISTLSYTHQYTTPGTYTVIVTDSTGACAATMIQTTIVTVSCSTITPCPQITSFTHINLPNNTGCQKFEFNAGISGYTGPPCPTSPLIGSINYGDGSPTYTNCADGGGFASSYQFPSAGTYTVNLTITGPGTCIATAKSIVTVTCNPPPCTDCISSFAPIPGKKYLVSAWVKEKNAPQSKTSYTFPSLTILFPSISASTSPFLASGVIIDGWQRVEGEFTIPVSATNMSIKLDCNTGDCYFDDVRVLPFDGSMKSYVYDPVTMRLVAELDERNYATLYEYDEEGKLIRVKKETEKGIMTIQENRNNTKK